MLLTKLSKHSKSSKKYFNLENAPIARLPLKSQKVATI
jgi:hypothetical protein